MFLVGHRNEKKGSMPQAQAEAPARARPGTGLDSESESRDRDCKRFSFYGENDRFEKKKIRHVLDVADDAEVGESFWGH